MRHPDRLRFNLMVNHISDAPSETMFAVQSHGSPAKSPMCHPVVRLNSMPCFTIRTHIYVCVQRPCAQLQRQVIGLQGKAAWTSIFVGASIIRIVIYFPTLSSCLCRRRRLLRTLAGAAASCWCSTATVSSKSPPGCMPRQVRIISFLTEVKRRGSGISAFAPLEQHAQCIPSRRWKLHPPTCICDSRARLPCGESRQWITLAALLSCAIGINASPVAQSRCGIYGAVT